MSNTKYIIDSDTLTDIADAIREKTGEQSTITPRNMAAAITGITGSSGTISANVTKSGSIATITITDSSGTTTATVSDGQDGESGVYVGTTAPSDPDVNVWIDTDGTDDITEIVTEVVDQVEVKTETVSGTAVTINGVANTRYVCGEVSTISITPPATGIIDVIFTSGSSVAVLTLPQTVKMPSGFAVATNTTYEINILDGVYGVVAEWT